MVENSVELKIKIAQAQLAQEASAANDTIRDALGAAGLNAEVTVETDGAKSELSGLQSTANQILEGIGQGIGQRLTDAITNSLAAIPNFLTDAIGKATDLQRVMAGVQGAIKATGGAAGLSLQDLDALAQELGRSTLTNREAVLTASRSLLTFKTVQGETFERAIRLSNDLSETLGTDLTGSTVQLGKALEDPIQGINALRRSGVSFSEEQKAQIANLVEQNKLIEAQAIVLDVVEQQVGGVAEAAAAGLGGSLDTFAEEVDQLQTTIGRDLADGLAPLVNIGSAAVASIRELIETFVALPAPVKLTVVGITGFTAVLGAGVIALTAYQLASKTTAANLLAQNVAQLKATAIQIKDTVATTAATAAKTAYAVATGQATAAQVKFIATVAKGAATLGLLAAAAASVLAVVDTFQSVDAAASETRDSADALRDSLGDLANTGAVEGMEDLADVTGNRLASDIERAREELNGFQRILDDLIRGPIPGLATAAEASANRNAVAFGELTGEVDNVLDVMDRFRAEGLEGQSEEDIATLTAAIEQAQDSLENAEIPENMRASAEVYIQSLEWARAELEELNQEQAAAGNQGGSFGDAFAGGQEALQERLRQEEEAAEAALQARLDGVRQENELAASERERAQTEEIAAVRAQVADRLITEEQAQQQINQIRQNGLDAELAAVEEQIAQVEQLRAEGALSQEEATQQIADLESEAAGIRLEQIDSEIAAQEELRQAEIERLDEVLETERSLAQERQANIDQSINALRQESEVLSARAGLQQAQADLANQRLQAEIEAAEAAGDTQEAEALRGDLLEQQAEQLADQQEIEREQLRISQEQNALELERQAVLAEIATTEAEIAIQQAITEGATSAEIANLERMLSLRQQQEQFVAQSAQQQMELNDLANRELATRQQIAQEALSTERSINAANQATAANSSSPGSSPGSSRGSSGGGGLLGADVALFNNAKNQLDDLLRTAQTDVGDLISFATRGTIEQQEFAQRALASSAAADVLQFVKPVEQSDLARTGTEADRRNAQLNDTLQGLKQQIGALAGTPRSVNVSTPDPVADMGSVLDSVRSSALRGAGL